MKKILCAILAVSIASIGLVSCAKKDKDGYMTVESKTCAYSFDCPESWTVSYTDGMLSAYNPDDLSKANVTAFSFNHGLDEVPLAADYWSQYKAQLSDTFGDVTEHEVKEDMLGGLSGIHADYTVTIGTESFDCETVLAIYDSDVYTLTLTQGAKENYNSESYNDHSDEFSQIIKTFRFN